VEGYRAGSGWLSSLRTLCHNGVANPCDRSPRREGQYDSNREAQDAASSPAQKAIKRLSGMCSLVQFGRSWPRWEAVSEDHTGRRLAALLFLLGKAYDQANRSGNWPYPDPAREVTICQRLRDRTPPDAAHLESLRTTVDSNRVGWSTGAGHSRLSRLSERH
jgi:hypothetical protein